MISSYVNNFALPRWHLGKFMLIGQKTMHAFFIYFFFLLWSDLSNVMTEGVLLWHSLDFIKLGCFAEDNVWENPLK